VAPQRHSHNPMMNGFTLRDLAMRGVPPQTQLPTGAPDFLGPPVQQPPAPQGWANAPSQMPAQAGTNPAFLRQPGTLQPSGNGFQGQQGNGMMPEHLATLLQMIQSRQR
jgi:hypothetical protein